MNKLKKQSSRKLDMYMNMKNIYQVLEKNKAKK